MQQGGVVGCFSVLSLELAAPSSTSLMTSGTNLSSLGALIYKVRIRMRLLIRSWWGLLSTCKTRKALDRDDGDVGGGGGAGPAPWDRKEGLPVLPGRVGRALWSWACLAEVSALQVEAEHRGYSYSREKDALRTPELWAWRQGKHKREVPTSQAHCVSNHERKLARLEKYGLWANAFVRQTWPVLTVVGGLITST